MDDTLATHLLSSLLPPDLVNLVNKNLLHPNSPGQALYHTVLQNARRVYASLLPLLQPLFDRLLSLLEDNQGYVDVLVPLMVLVTLVFVMNWVRRIIMWCTRLAMRAVFWSCVVALAAWIWNRGVIESARDAAIVGAKVVGYLAVLKDVWLDEYKRYEGAQATGRWDEFSHTRRSTAGGY
ncbi:hypothetical protein PT974_08829 [Cladobotryum mycophilum]|uniref:Uncharacterized protein n=1 Tax=Cladobotryum mycophilum TaxID=491253 RepID=A0ABR0SFM6_9HYPO